MVMMIVVFWTDDDEYVVGKNGDDNDDGSVVDVDNCPTSPRQHGFSCRPPRNFVSAPCDEVDAAEDGDDIDDEVDGEQI